MAWVRASAALGRRDAGRAAAQVGGRRGVLLVLLGVQAGKGGQAPTVTIVGAQSLSAGEVRPSSAQGAPAGF